MKAGRIDSTEFRRQLGEMIDRVMRGERLVVTKYGRPQFAMVPIEDWERLEALMPKPRRKVKP